ncbi:MAG: ceramidase domain-containing protein [Acidobacteriota bacterium]
MTRVAMLLWAGGTLLAIVILLLFFLAVTDVDRTIPAGFSRGDQCETLNLGGSILEPQNTWSNVGYLLAGLLIFYRSRRLRSVVVGLFLCLTGVFSAMYHAVPTNGTLQMLDIAAVNWVLLAMIGYAVLSLDLHFYGNPRDVVYEKLIAVISLVLGTVMAVTRTEFALFESTLATVSLVVVLVALLLWGYVGGKDPKSNLSTYEKITFLTVVIIIAIPTALFRLFDGLEKGVEKALCDPDGLFQAHAAWHMLSALLLLIAFDYFARVANESDERIFADAD